MLYQTIGDKQVPFNKNHGYYEVYRRICLKIWGALPLDVTWAVNTPIYKREDSNEKEKDKVYQG